MNDCSCPAFSDGERKIWCERHQCWKTKAWVKLCKTREDYRTVWDEGRGPGQAVTDAKPATTRRRRVKGVGDHLKELNAELKIRMKQGCNCPALLAEMNALGVDGCRQNRTRLVKSLAENAAKYTWGETFTAAVNSLKTGLAWQIDLLDPYGSLLDEAIRRADSTHEGS